MKGFELNEKECVVNDLKKMAMHLSEIIDNNVQIQIDVNHITKIAKMKITETV
jgi:hypothetical protein